MLFYFCCLLLLPFFQTRFGWLALPFKLPFPASVRTCGCSGCTLKHTNVVPETANFCLPAGESKAEQTQTPSLTSDSSYAHFLTACLQPDSHIMCCWYAKQLLLRGQRVYDCVYMLEQKHGRICSSSSFLDWWFYNPSLLTKTAPCATFIAALKNT